MVAGLPNWINLLFLFTVGVTILFFYYANGKRRGLLFGVIIWSALQSIIAWTGFYNTTDTLPPRFGLVLVPVLLFIIIGCLPKYRKSILNQRNLVTSTFLHTVRLPVEIVLFYLFTYDLLPELMTFEGRNFDIFTGITAPIVAGLILNRRASNTLLIAWNLVGLALVLFIMANGILSAPLPIQQFGFEQPNTAVLYFPFVLLPAVIVPVVIYTHLTDLVLLFNRRKQQAGNGSAIAE